MARFTPRHFLLFLFPNLRYRHAADAPVIGVNFVDNHNRGGGVFVQHAVQKLRCSFDKLFFLLRRYVALAGNFNVNVWHGRHSFLFYYNTALKILLAI